MTFFLTTYYLHSFCFNTRKLVYHISLTHEKIRIDLAKIHNKFYYHNNGISSPKPELWILFISGSYPSNDHIIIIKAKPISYCNKYFDFHPNFLLLFLTELENFTLYPWPDATFIFPSFMGKFLSYNNSITFIITLFFYQKHRWSQPFHLFPRSPQTDIFITVDYISA